MFRLYKPYGISRPGIGCTAQDLLTNHRVQVRTTIFQKPEISLGVKWKTSDLLLQC
jgi:hypothetical protein